MGFRLTKRQTELLALLSSGHTDRETYLRLRISESQFHHDWQALGHRIKSGIPETIGDYQTIAAYERVERLRLEAEVWASEARLTALMDTSLEVVFLINGRSGRILKANNRAFVMLGYSPRELLNQPMEMLVDPDLQAKHVGLRNGFLNSVRKRELGYHPPIFAITKDGRRIDLEIALTVTMATEDVMVVCKELNVEADSASSAGSHDSGSNSGF